MSDGYYKKIDIIRIFSCIAVFLYHMGILKGGYLAVNIFFVLTAYLAVRSFQNHPERTISRYYIGRFRRIYVPLLLTVFVSVAFLAGSRWQNVKSETLSVLLGYNNYWQLNASFDYFVRHISSPFIHFWFIAILLQFTVVIPFLYRILKRTQKISGILPSAVPAVLGILSFVCFCIFVLQGKTMSAYYGSFARSYALFFGISLAFLHAILPPLVGGNRDLNRIVFIIYLALAAVLCLIGDAASPFFALYMILSTLIGLRLTEHAVAEGGGETESPYLSFLAKYTYEFYLVQYPVIFLFQDMKIPLFLKLPLVLILCVLLTYALRQVTEIEKSTCYPLLKTAVCVLLLLSSMFGSYRYIVLKDTSAETDELKKRIEENKELIEEKNKEYQAEAEMSTEEKVFRSVENEEQLKEAVHQLPVMGIGDSVMLDAAHIFYDVFPKGYFDGEISRRMKGATELMEDLKNEGKLGNILILCLANNGEFSRNFSRAMMEVIGDRDVYWVNAVGADDPDFNARFAEFAKDYPNLHIVDWEKASKPHPEFFYMDGVHLKPGAGMEAYVNTIYDAVYADWLVKYREYKAAQAEGETPQP